MSHACDRNRTTSQTFTTNAQHADTTQRFADASTTTTTTDTYAKRKTVSLKTERAIGEQLAPLAILQVWRRLTTVDVGSARRA